MTCVVLTFHVMRTEFFIVLNKCQSAQKHIYEQIQTGYQHEHEYQNGHMWTLTGILRLVQYRTKITAFVTCCNPLLFDMLYLQKF